MVPLLHLFPFFFMAKFSFAVKLGDNVIRFSNMWSKTQNLPFTINKGSEQTGLVVKAAQDVKSV